MIRSRTKIHQVLEDVIKESAAKIGATILRFCRHHSPIKRLMESQRTSGAPLAVHKRWRCIMKFEDIEFESRRGVDRSTLGLWLPGKYWVEKVLFKEAWTRIWKACPTGVWQGTQTTETLCEDPDWRARDCGVRIKLGRCVKYFVSEEMLPLKLSNPGKKGKRKYIQK